MVLQKDAQNLLEIVNRGSSKLPIDGMTRELFWFSLRHRNTILVEWAPREENAFADEISKMYAHPGRLDALPELVSFFGL